MAKTTGDGRDRRAAILDAARFLGLRLGMKGVTVEAIAREARVAKPTLYGYFSNKDEIFAGVMESLIAEMTQGFQAALREEGALDDRLARALTAKHMAAMRLLERSPHAAELYSEHDRVAGPQFKALEGLVDTAIAEEMRRARIDQPELLAGLLAAATYGVAAKARTPEQLAWGIDLITRQLLAGANKQQA